MNRKKIYFGTNLKMYKGNQETIQYLSKLSQLTSCIQTDLDMTLFVIPSFTSLQDAVMCVRQQNSSTNIKIGAQNMNAQDQGQYTGDISPLMLKEIGVNLVMIGHSERRHNMKETDQEENKKVQSALSHGFHTLLCIGETSEQKNYGISDEILRTQLKIGLHNITKEQLSLLWIAYEPVWAIGENGIPASADYAESKHKVIKQCLSELFGEEGENIPVLYGGSVNLGNAPELITQPHIDGLFVGRSAWQADNFYNLITSSLQSLSLEKNEENNNDHVSKIAKMLLQALGGVGNINALTHCATRLRVVLKDDTKINKFDIEKIKHVKGVFSLTNQIQIILGKGLVEQVYIALEKQRLS